MSNGCCCEQFLRGEDFCRPHRHSFRFVRITYSTKFNLFEIQNSIYVLTKLWNPKFGLKKNSNACFAMQCNAMLPNLWFLYVENSCQNFVKILVPLISTKILFMLWPKLKTLYLKKYDKSLNIGYFAKHWPFCKFYFPKKALSKLYANLCANCLLKFQGCASNNWMYLRGEDVPTSLRNSH